MKAWRIVDGEQGPRGQFTDMERSALSEGDVLIRVRYSSLNYKDALAITGRGRIARTRPLNAGIDAAGEVEASDDPRWSAGDPVLVTGWQLSETRDGGLAEFVRVPGDCVTRLPDGLTAWEAMALGTAGFTAGLAIQRLQDSGQTPEAGPVLVTGAAGGVGSFAIEMLAAAGFEPVAVTRRVTEQGAWLRTLGANEVITPDALDLGGRPLGSETYGGAVDALGGDVLANVLGRIRRDGNVAAIGLAAGAALPTSVLPFILRGVSLLGVDSVMCPAPRREAVWRRLAGELKPAHLDRIAGRTETLEAIGPICESILAGEHAGRTVVSVRE